MGSVHTIVGRNINEVFQLGVMYFQDLVERGKTIETRGGTCIRHHGPLITQYNVPRERVLFNPLRDANPFFHLMESLWMLAGREDVEFLVKFNANMKNFTDDAEVYHGAYGYRWRKTFGVDQLSLLIKELKEKPNSRRAILQIWSAERDLNKDSLDIPCNDLVQFEIDNGVLNMNVFNRSNDMIWGAYGANVVQFSMLQEYLAGMLGIQVGQYWQISCNFHIYTDVFEKFINTQGISDADEYLMQNLAPYNLVDNPEFFDEDLFEWFENPSYEKEYANSFFHDVATPVYNAWEARKNGETELAFKFLRQCKAQDWALACQQWIERRVK